MERGQREGIDRRFEQALFISTISDTPISNMLVMLLVQGEGYQSSQVGLVAGVTPLLVACICILWGRAPDTRKRLMAFSSAIQFLNVGLILLMLVTKDFTLFSILNLIRNILMLPCLGMQEEYLLYLADTKEVKYGRIRKWDTVGHAFTNLVASVLVGSAGLDGILILGAVPVLVAGGLFGILPEIGKWSKEAQVEHVEKVEDYLLG